MLDLVTFGETMVAFTPTEKGAIRYASSLGKRTAGAESNIAIGLSKLGKKVGWFSKLGEDEFGEYILRELRGEGVDTSTVVMSKDNPTGIMFKQFSAGNETSVFYYRKGSAASTMTPEDLPMEYIKQSKILYISGITPALSNSCRETLFAALDFANKVEHKIQICFDPNIRLKLWNKEEAKECLSVIFNMADIVLIGDEEAEILFGNSEPDHVIEHLRKLNVSKMALKLGDKGAVVADKNSSFHIEPLSVEVVDNIGAGDAFNAGFLCGHLDGKSIEECGKMGAIMGAYAVSSFGDVEGLPNRNQLDALLNKKEKIYR
jgi:2-dehydro-3-deoxygluconokinase